MSKGLKLTLMTVAVAMMAAQAMAMAPLIGDVPSPVVGDQETNTPANTFVYPDAFNLTNYVSDDTSTAASIIWSFSTADTAKFAINGHGPLPSLAPAGIITPASPINTSVINGEENPDSNAATLTIRDVNLSPIGGPNTAPPAGGESQIVTLFASDGTTFSQKDVLFYAVPGADHLSVSWTEVATDTFEGSTEGWTSSALAGSVTLSTSSGHMICIQVALDGANAGYWSGPWGELVLVKNNLYRIRMQMQGSQSGTPTASDVPFWDLIINNFSYDGTNFHGMNLYGLNYFFLDNTGRANAVTTDAKEFQAWWCPSPIVTTQWNVETNGSSSGPFAPENAANKDAYFQFRILDDPNNGGTTGNLDQGSVCLDGLTVERTDWNNLSIVSTPYNADGNLVDGRTTATGNKLWPSNLVNATATFASGALTLAPGSGGQTSLLATVEPGDTTIDYSTMAGMSDNFPAPIEPQKAYLVTLKLSCSDPANSPDVFWVGADVPTNELICLTYVTNNCNHSAIPTSGTPQEYKSLFWSNYATLDSNPAFLKLMRPRFMMGNVTDLAVGNNSGSITISGMRVDEVQVQ